MPLLIAALGVDVVSCGIHQASAQMLWQHHPRGSSIGPRSGGENRSRAPSSGRAAPPTIAPQGRIDAQSRGTSGAIYCG